MVRLLISNIMLHTYIYFRQTCTNMASHTYVPKPLEWGTTKGTPRYAVWCPTTLIRLILQPAMEVHDMPAKKNTIPTQLVSILADGTQPKHVRIGPTMHKGTARNFPSPPHPFPDNSQRISRAHSPMTHTHHTHCQAHEVPQIVVIGTQPMVQRT